MGLAEFRAVLSKGQDRDTFQQLKELFLEHATIAEENGDWDFLDNEVFPYLQQHLKDWEDDHREATDDDTNEAELHDGLFRWIRLCRTFEQFRLDEFDKIEWMLDPEEGTWLWNRLSLMDDGDMQGNWGHFFDECPIAIKELSILQVFGHDSFGAALLSGGMELHSLTQLEVRVEGYEAYCDFAGLDIPGQINRPELRSLASGYYPIHPPMLEVLRNGNMGMLEALHLCLLSGTHLKTLLDARWTSQLETLSLEFVDEADDNGTEHEEWQAENIEDFEELDFGDGYFPDGTTLLDRELETIAQHPYLSGLKRLAIDTEQSLFSEAGIAALQSSPWLQELEELYMTVPDDFNTEDLATQFTMSPNFPSLRVVHITQGGFSEKPWDSWHLSEFDGETKPLKLREDSHLEWTS